VVTVFLRIKIELIKRESKSGSLQFRQLLPWIGFLLRFELVQDEIEQLCRMHFLPFLFLVGVQGGLDLTSVFALLLGQVLDNLFMHLKGVFCGQISCNLG